MANITPKAALSYIQTDAYVMLAKVRHINIYVVRQESNEIGVVFFCLISTYKSTLSPSK